MNLSSYGQHLESTKGFKKHKGPLKEYYDDMFPLLFKGFSGKPIARYTSIPSFANEYSFSVEQMNGENYVVSNKLSTNYWYAKDREKVKLISRKAKISKDLISKIIELFNLLRGETKKSENDEIGLDGAIYYFTTINNEGEINIGKTWSPDKMSNLGQLVSICDEIFALGGGEKISQEKILANIDSLIVKIKR